MDRWNFMNWFGVECLWRFADCLEFFFVCWLALYGLQIRCECTSSMEQLLMMNEQYIEAYIKAYFFAFLLSVVVVIFSLFYFLVNFPDFYLNCLLEQHALILLVDNLEILFYWFFAWLGMIFFCNYLIYFSCIHPHLDFFFFPFVCFVDLKIEVLFSVIFWRGIVKQIQLEESTLISKDFSFLTNFYFP